MKRLGAWAIRIGSMGLTLLACAVGAVLYLSNVAGPEPKAGAVIEGARGKPVVTFNIPKGAGSQVVGRDLERAGLISSATIFRLAELLYLRGDKLQAGDYEFAPRTSLREIMQTLADGKVVQYRVTIPEGRSVAEAMDIIAKADFLSGKMPDAPPEGTMLPDTYMVARGTDRASLIKRMTSSHDRVLAELWAARAPNLPFSTPAEAVILASIVEKETGQADERHRVAGLYINRLRQGMRLESDPTIIYGITKGRPLGRGIRRSEIDAVTRWNTYQIDGLPPTPIANPGREALEATLNPMATDELFMVADGTGGHTFSRTYAEHNAAVARWRVIEREKAEAAARAAANPAATPASQATR
jgi:UPF0755 protein